MKTIIAGSRDIPKERAFYGIGLCMGVMSKKGMNVTEIVSGGARGVDKFGEEIGAQYGIPVKPMPVTDEEWSDITVPGAVVKVNKWGKKYNARAGHNRNARMAEYAEALIAIWDGKSSGTKDMIEVAQKKGMPVEIYRTDEVER